MHFRSFQLHYWVGIHEKEGSFLGGRWHRWLTITLAALFGSVFTLWSKLQTVIFLKSRWHSFVSGSCQKQRRPRLSWRGIKNEGRSFSRAATENIYTAGTLEP